MRINIREMVGRIDIWSVKLLIFISFDIHGGEGV